MENTTPELPDGTGRPHTDGQAMHAERPLRYLWCGEPHPEGELRHEADLGPLCGRCIAAIRSRGKPLTLKD
jgi:hypothetical protein